MEKTYYDELIENIEDENKAYAEERKELKERKSTRIKNLKIRKSNIRKHILLAGVSGIGLALATIGASKIFEEKPLQVVADELLADANLYETENGKSVAGKMTDQELVDYIKEHGLSLDDIKEETISSLKSNMINTEFGMDKVEKANPAVFEEESKGMGR